MLKCDGCHGEIEEGKEKESSSPDGRELVFCSDLCERVWLDYDSFEHPEFYGGEDK